MKNMISVTERKSDNGKISSSTRKLAQKTAIADFESAVGLSGKVTIPEINGTRVKVDRRDTGKRLVSYTTYEGTAEEMQPVVQAARRFVASPTNGFSKAHDL